MLHLKHLVLFFTLKQIGKNEIEIKQQMLKIIPPFKNWGNTGNH